SAWWPPSASTATNSAGVCPAASSATASGSRRTRLSTTSAPPGLLQVCSTTVTRPFRLCRWDLVHAPRGTVGSTGAADRRPEDDFRLGGSDRPSQRPVAFPLPTARPVQSACVPAVRTLLAQDNATFLRKCLKNNGQPGSSR